MLQVELLVVGNRRSDGLLAGGLLLGVMKLGQVRVPEGLGDADPFGWVEVQHLSQKVQSVTGGLGLEPLP